MASCARNVGTVLTVVEGSEGSCSSRDWQLLYEEAQVRVAKAEARAEEYRWAEVRARSKAASWKAQFEAGRDKLIEAREETKAVRRTARDALSLQAEVERLKRLLSAAGMSWRQRSTPVSLRRQVGQLQQKNTDLCRKNAKLRRSNALLRRRNAELRQEARTAVAGRDGMSARIGALEGELAALRASRAVLSKTLYGRKSGRQQKPLSERRRGQQAGARGHGRTARPGLEQRDEVQNLSARARVCSGCGTPYVANGDQSTVIVEIEVRAHRRRIVRPRWRRACGCGDSPRAVTAPAPHRLYPRTSYGTSVWACVLFERYVCHRPLNGVAGWLSHQGLPVSAGTLAGGAPGGAGPDHGGGGAGGAVKHLARHLGRLGACFARLPDPRRGRNRRYAMRDIAMAALSVFFLQSPSFLAHQRALTERHARSNAHTLFGLARIPCGNHIRQLLDGVLFGVGVGRRSAR